jgi:hypothetical protein
VPHLDQRLDGALHVAVGGAAGLVEVADDGAGIPFDGHQAGRVVMTDEHEHLADELL